MKTLVSRLAPTPSGLLHLGNAMNFILTWWLVRQNQGVLHLRIDDADVGRRRDEFIEDIFESLNWLGIDWDKGPKDTGDFLANHSQSLKKGRYFQAAQKLRNTYFCECSRKDIKEHSPNGVYSGVCREKNLKWLKNHTAMKIVAPSGAGDVVLWRKDDIPAYHLTSVVDDNEAQVNVIVRGEDLLESTAVQLWLEDQMGARALREARFIHHPLLKDSQGQKLSKSQTPTDAQFHLKLLREQGWSAGDVLKRLAPDLGLDPSAAPATLGELLSIPFPKRFEQQGRLNLSTN